MGICELKNQGTTSSRITQLVETPLKFSSIKKSRTTFDLRETGWGVPDPRKVSLHRCALTRCLSGGRSILTGRTDYQDGLHKYATHQKTECQQTT